MLITTKGYLSLLRYLLSQDIENDPTIQESQVDIPKKFA